MPATVDAVLAMLDGRRLAIWNSGRSMATVKDLALLQRLCGMFGSDFAGERSTAARLADNLIRRLGLTWLEVLHLPGTEAAAAAEAAIDSGGPEWWAAAIAECRRRPHRLSPTEIRFLATVATRVARGKTPSPKQQKWIIDILRRPR